MAGRDSARRNPFSQNQLGLFCVTAGEKGDAELREQSASEPSAWEERRRALEQVDRSGHVSSLESANAGLAQAVATVLRESFGPPVELAELTSQLEGPLEVVADEFVELSQIRSGLIETVGEALVQLSSESLRCRAVDRLLDDEVAKAECVLFGRPEEAARNERLEMGSDGRGCSGLEQRRHIVVRKTVDHDRASFENGSLPGPSRSRRAASSACTVSGKVCSARPPSNASASNCSTKNGFPSAVSEIRAR